MSKILFQLPLNPENFYGLCLFFYFFFPLGLKSVLKFTIRHFPEWQYFKGEAAIYYCKVLFMGTLKLNKTDGWNKKVHDPRNLFTAQSFSAQQADH